MSDKPIFKAVPLNNQWASQGTKHDLKAIYRRRRTRVGEYDEVIEERGPDGRPLWDLTGPLPLRRHSDWQSLGYEYVTVYVQPPHMSGSLWPTVASWLRSQGLNAGEYLQHPELGTWNPKLYLATADRVDGERFSALRGLVERLGSEAVLAVRRSEDPTFSLPADLLGIEPGGTVPEAAETVATIAGAKLKAPAKKNPVAAPSEVQA